MAERNGPNTAAMARSKAADRLMLSGTWLNLPEQSDSWTPECGLLMRATTTVTENPSFSFPSIATASAGMSCFYDEFRKHVTLQFIYHPTRSTTFLAIMG